MTPDKILSTISEHLLGVIHMSLWLICQLLWDATDPVVAADELRLNSVH